MCASLAGFTSDSKKSKDDMKKKVGATSVKDTEKRKPDECGGAMKPFKSGAGGTGEGSRSSDREMRLVNTT